MALPWRRLGIYLELVYTFPSAVLVGTAAGYFVDRWLSSKPVGTLAGFLLGLAGAFWYLFKVLNRVGRRGER